MSKFKENWCMTYASRVLKARSKIKPKVGDKIRVNVYVQDLLDKSGLSKSDFYTKLFEINEMLDNRLVLYLDF